MPRGRGYFVYLDHRVAGSYLIAMLIFFFFLLPQKATDPKKLTFSVAFCFFLLKEFDQFVFHCGF